MTKLPIVIVGGGFAGVRVALELDNHYGHHLDTPIFLIDSSPCHVYTPITDATIPFRLIFDGTRIHFIQEKVIKIDLVNKQVITESRRLKYHDLVIATGSKCRPITGINNKDNKIMVDGTLGAIEHPRVWVAGDIAAVSDSGSIRSAIAHGKHVARSIITHRQQRNPTAYYAWLKPKHNGAWNKQNVVHARYAVWKQLINYYLYLISILTLPKVIYLLISREPISEKRSILKKS